MWAKNSGERTWSAISRRLRLFQAGPMSRKTAGVVDVRRVPADAEPVTVGRLDAQPGVQALVDQGVRRLVEDGVEQDGRSRVGEPSAHRLPPSWRTSRRGEPAIPMVVRPPVDRHTAPYPAGDRAGTRRCAGRGRSAPISPEFPVERGAGDAQGRRRAGLVAAVAAQGLQDGGALGVLHRAEAPGRGTLPDGVRQFGASYRARDARRCLGQRPYEVDEFGDVAGPRMLLQRAQGIQCPGERGLSGGRPRGQRGQQLADVLGAFPQRGQGDRAGGQGVQEPLEAGARGSAGSVGDQQGASGCVVEEGVERGDVGLGEPLGMAEEEGVAVRLNSSSRRSGFALRRVDDQGRLAGPVRGRARSFRCRARRRAAAVPATGPTPSPGPSRGATAPSARRAAPTPRRGTAAPAPSGSSTATTPMTDPLCPTGTTVAEHRAPSGSRNGASRGHAGHGHRFGHRLRPGLRPRIRSAASATASGSGRTRQARTPGLSPPCVPQQRGRAPAPAPPAPRGDTRRTAASLTSRLRPSRATTARSCLLPRGPQIRVAAGPVGGPCDRARSAASTGAGRRLGEGGAGMRAHAGAQARGDRHRADGPAGLRGEHGHADRGHVLPQVEEVLGAVHLGAAPGAQGERRAVVADHLFGEVSATGIARRAPGRPQHPQPFVGEQERRPPVPSGGGEPFEHRPGRGQQGGPVRSYGLRAGGGLPGRRRGVRHVVPYAEEPGTPPGGDDLLRYAVRAVRAPSGTARGPCQRARAGGRGDSSAVVMAPLTVPGEVEGATNHPGATVGGR